MKEYNSQIDYSLDVISILDEYVHKVASEKWKEDKCKPDFIVSLNNEDMDNQQIMITISHCGIRFTEKIFPRKKMEYGYDSLENQMSNMYNQTM